MASRSSMASRRLSRKPGCLNLAINVKEINSANENPPQLDVTLTGKLRDDFGSDFNAQYLTPLSGGSASPTILVDRLSAMVEASDMDLQDSSIKEKTFELGGRGVPIKAVDHYMHSSDWSFMVRARASNSTLFETSIPSHCPSLGSSSTISSRNSSTRSAKSLKWPGPERLREICPEDIDVNVQQGRLWDDRLDSVNARPLVPPYEIERPHKCPIKSCQYHVRGFTRVFDRLRHTNTHFMGTFVCGFCPSGDASATRTFNREDVFSRHLINVHRAKQASATRRKELYSTGTIEELQKPSTGALVATCTQCSEPFDVQGFYEHLPGCTYRRVTRDSQDALDEDFDDLDTDDEKDSLGPGSPVMPRESIALANLPSLQEVRSILQYAKLSQERSTISPFEQTALQSNTDELAATSEETAKMEELAASSRCLSLTSSKGINTSDEETDCTVDDFSPESETESVAVQPMFSPLKRQLIDRVMMEFHSLFDQAPTNFRTHYGGNGNEGSHGYAASSSHASSSGDSPLASRKRSLSGGGSTPPNDRRNDGDDHKRRRADTKIPGNDLNPDLRFACPYYKRNPGRHQTFTSCRDPGFITVARLKEHLYRRHLLPIQCNRCCTTFANEPALREHQRDRQGCEVRDQVPIEGFDKDQERKLKSKKRSLVHQSEEDKWKCVYRILFPDDNDADIPSPFIEYQPHNSSGPSQESNMAHFQEFSRLELPRLVRRTLEAVVEREAQPLEEKLKERLVDIVEQCQSQLISMFQSIGGTLNPSESPSSLPASTAPPQPDTLSRPPSHELDAPRVPNPATLTEHTRHPIIDPRFPTADPTLESVNPERPSNVSTISGSPDSGYDSTWTAVSYPQDCPFDAYFGAERGYLGFEGFEGFGDGREADVGYDASMWTVMDPLIFHDGYAGGAIQGGVNVGR